MESNYYDDMKELMNVSRAAFGKKSKSGLLREFVPNPTSQSAQPTGNETPNPNDSPDAQTITDPEIKQEESEFNKNVSPQVQFNQLKMYPKGVEWSGVLMAERIQWFYSLDDTTGCYMLVDSPLQLRDETLQVLNKLRGYYDIWRKNWSEKINQNVNQPSMSPDSNNQQEDGNSTF